MTNPEIFTGKYYADVIERNGYDTSVFDGFTEDLPSIPRNELQDVFLCHKGLYDFRDSPKDKGIITGFGLSGVPHLGTLSQLYRASILNKEGGYYCQVVLGDLDAYNGKSVPLETTKQLAKTYARFIDKTELLDKNNSEVRSQNQQLEVLKTAYLIGHFATDHLFEEAEEDLHSFYTKNGKVDSTMSYRRKLSLNLMIADFIHLGQSRPEVLVMLGIDEHQYVRAAQKIASIVNPEVSGLQPVNITSIYTPMIRGLRGYPKMSKSFPESGITLEMDETEIEAAIYDEADDFQIPEDSVIFQIACAIGTGKTHSTSEIRQAAIEKTEDWQAIKERLVGRIASFASLWKEAKEQC